MSNTYTDSDTYTRSTACEAYTAAEDYSAVDAGKEVRTTDEVAMGGTTADRPDAMMAPTSGPGPPANSETPTRTTGIARPD